MEKALLLSPSQAETFRGKAAGYSTLIVGSEFCQNQIPTAAALMRLGETFRGGISLATSLMTDGGLARWEELLRRLKKNSPVSGIIVNDFGFFPAVKKAGLVSVSLGGLLAREFVKMEPGWARAFLKGHGVVSAEADTPELAVLVSGKLGLKVSWHPDLIFRAVTTYCPFEKHFGIVCGRSCEGKLLKLSNRHLDFKLVLAEKAYFAPAAGNAAPKNVWRKVFRPGRGIVI